MIALHAAAGRGHVEAVKALLKANVDLSVRSNIGSTALLMAVTQGGTEVVKILLRAGADISISGYNGMTALHHAFRK